MYWESCQVDWLLILIRFIESSGEMFLIGYVGCQGRRWFGFAVGFFVLAVINEAFESLT